MGVALGQSEAQAIPTRKTAGAWQAFWFLIHLALVYLLVSSVTPWLAGWVGGSLLPVLGYPKSSSQFQFLFSHLLALSFVPAFLMGLINAKFKQRVAAFVWLVPAAILAYKFLIFPTSILQARFSAAFHEYFAGGFSIPEYRDWQDFWQIALSNGDVERGMTQLHITAPFYAGVAYSAAVWVGIKLDLGRWISQKVDEWEESRFGPRRTGTID